MSYKQPDQAGQVLTDEEIEAAWYECDDYETKRAYFDAGVHWAQKAVLAKRVPMTDEEIFNAYCASDSNINTNTTNLFLFARAIERHHGIISDKAGA